MEDVAVIRPASLSDFERLVLFSEKAGSGITSLPINPQILENKLRSVGFAFSKEILSPQHETYLFCLEWQNDVIGVCGIVSRVGMTEPFFSYHLLHERLSSHHLEIDKEVGVLHFIEARKKPTELGSLFLLEEFRSRFYGFGKLLSLCRFLFIANFRYRFAKIVIAEIRGFNENGISPFWDAIGRKFFGVNFPEADYLRTSHPFIIEELFPKHPIYVNLLSKPAQEAIGMVHSDTLPAMKLLEKQGFKKSGYYDLFDAGPHIFAPVDQIDAIKRSRIASLVEIRDDIQNENKAIFSNTHLDFRACLSHFTLTEGEDVILPKAVAHSLKLRIGDPMRYYPLG